MTKIKSKISINIDKIIGKVSPYLFGHFIEHFPRQIYGGIFEEDSPFSDSMGFRIDVQGVLKEIRPSLIRWPGGNYTSGYHWKWGAGPRSLRKYRENPHWNEYEDHHFGTTEFFEFCKRIEAEPLICVGVGRDKRNPTPEEVASWVKYCNSLNDPEAELRSQAGYPEPLNIKWWGLGNECWGEWQIGYYKSAIEYGKDVLEYMNKMLQVDNSLRFVIVGGDRHFNRKWNDDLFSIEEIARNIEILSWHHYFQIGDVERVSHLKATLDLRRVERRLDRIIKLIQQTCQRIGRENPIKIAVDEWNEFGWEEVNIEKNAEPSQYDLAHALYTAGFLNLLIRRSNYIFMANYSPIVNTRGLIYANDKGVLKRTSFHVYKIYSKCSGGFSLENQVNSPNLKDSNALILDVSSIRMNDDLIYVYVINRDDENNTITKFEIPEFSVKKGNALILTANDLRSFNDFKSQDTIISRDYEFDAYGETFELRIPRQSICLIELCK
jgi:alpha-L-arabinofuranosidase